MTINLKKIQKGYIIQIGYMLRKQVISTNCGHYQKINEESSLMVCLIDQITKIEFKNGL